MKSKHFTLLLALIVSLVKADNSTKTLPVTTTTTTTKIIPGPQTACYLEPSKRLYACKSKNGLFYGKGSGCDYEFLCLLPCSSTRKTKTIPTTLGTRYSSVKIEDTEYCSCEINDDTVFDMDKCREAILLMEQDESDNTTTITTTTTTTKVPPVTTTTTTTTKVPPVTTTTTTTNKIPPVTTTTTTTKVPPVTTTTTTTKVPPVTTTTTTTTSCIPWTYTVTETVKETITEKQRVTVTVVADTTPDVKCAGKWAQCGGVGFNGPTCCEPGTSCHVLSEHYSQCY